jgi:hypothetical protein
MTPELDSAVVNARRVFSRYALNGRIIVCNCPCCVAPEVERELIRTPLHELSSALLAEYTNSAHGWDDKVAQDLRYFLPRYFELIARDDVPCQLDLEVCLRRLANAAWHEEWPAAEAKAIDDFFVAMLRSRLGASLGKTDLPTGYQLFTSGEAAEAVLCLAANAGGDMQQLLEAWDEDSSRPADVRLARMIVSADWRARQLSNSWWIADYRPHAEQAMKQVIAWILRTETWERLEAAGLEETDEMIAELFSQAEGIIARNA